MHHYNMSSIFVQSIFVVLCRKTNFSPRSYLLIINDPAPPPYCILCDVYNSHTGSVIRRYPDSRERQLYQAQQVRHLISVLRPTRFDPASARARAQSDRITGVNLHYFPIFIKTVRNLSRYINETGACITNNKFNKQNDASFIRGEGIKKPYTYNTVYTSEYMRPV